MGCEQSGFWPWGAIGEQEAGGCSPVLRPPGVRVLPSPSPPALSSLPPAPLLQPAEPHEEPWGCCVSCSSSEFYSAPLTLADRPQGMGQKDNCLQQFCPQLVSPSAFRAAQPGSYWLTNIIKFNSRHCEQGGGGGNSTFGGLLVPFDAPNRGEERRGAELCLWPRSPARLCGGGRGAGGSIHVPVTRAGCGAVLGARCPHAHTHTPAGAGTTPGSARANTAPPVLPPPPLRPRPPLGAAVLLRHPGTLLNLCPKIHGQDWRKSLAQEASQTLSEGVV